MAKMASNKYEIDRRLDALDLGKTVIYTATASGGTVTAEQARLHPFITNVGAITTNSVTLPPAEVGMQVTAIVEAAYALRLDPYGTETIADSSTGVQQAAGSATGADALGERITIACLTAGTWSVVDYNGTWTFHV